MKEAIVKEKKKSFHTKALAAIIALLFLLTTGTVVYHVIEQWSYLDSAYFTTITLATIGYGDLAPTNPVSKLFTIFFVFAGVGIFVFSVSIIAEHYFSRRMGMLERTVSMVNSKAQSALQRIGAAERDPKELTRRDFVKDMEIKNKTEKRFPKKESQKKQ